MKRNLLILIAVLFAAGFAVYRQHDGEKSLSAEVKPKLNYAAPVLELSGLDGQTYKLGGRRAKPVLVNFWASWCDPCKREAPNFQKLHAKYKDKLDVYGVNVTQVDKLANVQEFVGKYGIKYPVLLDREGLVAQSFQVQGFPTSFLIDETGTVRDVFYFATWDDLERCVKKWIK